MRTIYLVVVVTLISPCLAGAENLHNSPYNFNNSPNNFNNSPYKFKNSPNNLTILHTILILPTVSTITVEIGVGTLYRAPMVV
jgi:hypothetical protein